MESLMAWVADYIEINKKKKSKITWDKITP